MRHPTLHSVSLHAPSPARVRAAYTYMVQLSQLSVTNSLHLHNLLRLSRLHLHHLLRRLPRDALHVKLSLAECPRNGQVEGGLQWGPATLSTADAALEAIWSGAPTRTLEHDLDLARALKRLADHLHLRKQVRAKP